MKKLLLFGMMLTILSVMCGPTPQEKEVQTLIESYLDQVKPLEKKYNLAYWQAATTGSSEAYENVSKAEYQLKQIHSNPDDFAKIKKMLDYENVSDPLLKRQLLLLRNAYLPNQIDSTLMKQIIQASNAIDKQFSSFRGEIDGKKVTSNDIEEILKTSKDSRERQSAWLASKQVGQAIAEDVIKLAKLRNQAATQLGFENYHTMMLTANEQDVETLDSLFAKLADLTEEPFRRVKAELDSILAGMYAIGVQGLMPWHYHDPFFQETPLVYEIDLDKNYQDRDVVKLSEEFFAGINLPVNAILENSDLYEREGKNPHAFCTDIDREGDVRILCNVKNNERWMETMLHELGHAVYDKYMDPDTPYILRTPAQSFTTEGIAMLFGRLSRDAAWMQRMLELSDEERTAVEGVSERYAQLKQLIFARWSMVMYNFEKQLYANPDQDLNALWWDLVETYQLVQKPPHRDEPDWAAKIHIALYPCYYQNYLMGELFASQLQNTIVNSVITPESFQESSFVGKESVGQFLTTHVFEPGARSHWNTMIKQATGEELTPTYFVDQFVK